MNEIFYQKFDERKENNLTLPTKKKKTIIIDIYHHIFDNFESKKQTASNIQDSLVKKLSNRKWRKEIPFKEFPLSLA